jgi:competence protein ComEC
MALGMESLLWNRGPDILIDGQGRLMVTRAESGLLIISTAKLASFERDIWLRLAGQKGAAAVWPANGPDDRISCDIGSCLYRAGGVTVALVRHPSALHEDCWVADVIIATVPVRVGCRQPAVVIDRFDLWRNGAHAVWLEDGYARIESVNERRGHRPWVVRPASRRSG